MMRDTVESLMDRLLAQAKAKGADAADGVITIDAALEASVRLGKVEAVERTEDSEIGLRVFVGKRNAMISSSRIDEASIERLAERAVAMAVEAPEDPYAGIAEVPLLAQTIPDLELYDATEVDADALIQSALEAEDTALSTPGITNSEGGSASCGQMTAMLATSNGFSGTYRRSGHAISALVLAEKNGVMESDYDYSSAVWREDLTPPNAIGRRAAERTLARLGGKPPPTGSFPVIYDRRVSPSIAKHIASAINGAAIARGTSFLKNKMGAAIASAAITLTDDPLRLRGLASSPFDGEGLPRQKRVLVEGGILKGWLLDLASARQLGLTPTGNASYGAGGPPGPSTTNWIMASGTTSRADLIAEIEEGFLITELIGSSVNLITGDYSRGAAGFWIKNGTIAYPISEATIAGNLNTMLMNMTPADDPDLSRATIAPSIRIDGMTVAGG